MKHKTNVDYVGHRLGLYVGRPNNQTSLTDRALQWLDSRSTCRRVADTPIFSRRSALLFSYVLYDAHGPVTLAVVIQLPYDMRLFNLGSKTDE